MGANESPADANDAKGPEPPPLPHNTTEADEAPDPEPEVTPLVLLEDEPVPDHNQDELGLKPFAQTVASAAVGTGGPFTIGVFGDWGFGKTSLLRQARSLVEDYARKQKGASRPVTVWFNAWQYEKEEHLIVPLLATIVREIEEHESLWGKTKDLCRELGRLLLSTVYSISIKAPLPGVEGAEAGLDLSKIPEQYEKFRERMDPVLEQSLYFNAYERFARAATEAHSKGDGPKIVVFVDDLDRCMPDKAVNLLESIKLLLAQPGFVFVLAVHRAVVEEHLSSRFNGEWASRYLDKIVQLPFPVPSHESRFTQYVKGLIEKREALRATPGVPEILRELAPVLAVGSGYNPRTLVRFVNNLLVDRHIHSLRAPDGDEEARQAFLRTIAVSRALRLHLPSTQYDLLLKSDELCSKLAENPRAAVVELQREGKAGQHQTDLLVTLKRHAFLLDLFVKGVGHTWLKDHERRRKTDQFIIEQKREPVPQPEAAPSFGMRMVRIEPGRFLMGSEKGDGHEKPVHEVTLSRAFYLGMYPVTQAEYWEVMGINPSSFRVPNRPVENVSWRDAEDFCRRLSEKEGAEYRLPTEAEWEYACRAGGTSEYCFGDDESGLDEYAWYSANSDGETHPVGQKRANAWGLQDMHGNVWEWCQGWYGAYSADAQTDPTGPPEGTTRVVRGGSWGTDAYECRCACRANPALESRSSRAGFRVAMPLP